MATTQRRTFTAHTSKTNIEAARKRDLAEIHKGKKQLGWSDDDYKFHLRNLTGKSSSADMDAQERAKVLAHMGTLGYKPASRTFKPYTQADKIKHYWSELDKAGVLRDSSTQSLLAFVARVTGASVDDVSFLPTSAASTVIEALKCMQARAARAELQELDMKHGLPIQLLSLARAAAIPRSNRAARSSIERSPGTHPDTCHESPESIDEVSSRTNQLESPSFREAPPPAHVALTQAQIPDPESHGVSPSDRQALR